MITNKKYLILGQRCRWCLWLWLHIFKDCVSSIRVNNATVRAGALVVMQRERIAQAPNGLLLLLSHWHRLERRDAGHLWKQLWVSRRLLNRPHKTVRDVNGQFAVRSRLIVAAEHGDD